MRLILTTIVLMMLAQPVRALPEFGNFKLITADFCKKVMAKGVYLGHVGVAEGYRYRMTETRYIYKGEIYLIEISKFSKPNLSNLECRVFVPKE